jgi:carboxymethylenebutenolidase
MADVTIPVADGVMDAYLAVPGVDGPWPGVVVVHDALGPTTDSEHQADWLADHGYVALAPDLYHRGGRLRCMFAAMRSLAAQRGPAFDDLETARRWLTGRPDGTGRVGVIGFCMGGGFALVLACDGGYGAASVNYGALPGDLGRLARACPVVGSYGALDRSLRDVPSRLDAALTAGGVEHDIKVYPEAGHGFLNDHAPDETPVWAVVAGRFVHTGYHEPSAKDARDRILSFFGTHLSG